MPVPRVWSRSIPGGLGKASLAPSQRPRAHIWLLVSNCAPANLLLRGRHTTSPGAHNSREGTVQGHREPPWQNVAQGVGRSTCPKDRGRWSPGDEIYRRIATWPFKSHGTHLPRSHPPAGGRVGFPNRVKGPQVRGLSLPLTHWYERSMSSPCRHPYHHYPHR